MNLSVRKTTLVLACLVGAQCVVGWGTQYYALLYKPEFFASKDARGFIRYFYIAGEANVPSWFQSTALAACSLLIFAISTRKQSKAFRFHWIVLASMFLGLSLEETASILEGVGYRSQRVLPFSPTYLGVFGVVVLTVGYWQFLFSLPARSRIRFVIAGAIYVSGVIGLEMIGSLFDSYFRAHNIYFLTRAVIEEGLESIGVVLFMRALLLHSKEEAAEDVGEASLNAHAPHTIAFTIHD